MQPSSLHFTMAHINYVLVATWEAFKIPSATITHNALKKTHILPLYPPDIETTKLVSMVLNNQTEKNHTILDIYQRPVSFCIDIEAKQSNYVKSSARIIKRGSSYDNILSAVSNIDSTDPILQYTHTPPYLLTP